MTRIPPSFRLPDLRRAVKAFTDAGQTIDRVEIDPDGRIIVFAMKPAQAPAIEPSTVT